MKRLMVTILLLLLAVFPALAEPLTLLDDLTGEYIYPPGAAEADALYIYRYRYPQLAGDSEAAALINSTYAYTASDALGFEAPMLASDMQERDPQKLVDISYEITYAGEEYLSVAVYKRVTVGGDTTTVVNGHVFSLTGGKMGMITSLPYVLGLLEADETDEWYLDRQTAKADACVRELVWERLAELNAAGQITLYDDLTFEEFEAGFYPEEDFYLDENGDPVFYLLEGSIGYEEQGLILISIPMDELLDEI